MLKIDKEESDEDSDNPGNKSNTTTPKKVEHTAGNGNTESPVHVNNVNNSVITNVSIPMLPNVNIIQIWTFIN